MSFAYKRLSPKLVKMRGYHYPEAAWFHAHWCPACRTMHTFAVEQPFSNGARWTFNGNAESPTFAPSMNIRIGPFPVDEDEKKPRRMEICHYFLQAGKIVYLGDCTHELKGQTIDLPDVPHEALRFVTELKE